MDKNEPSLRVILLQLSDDMFFSSFWCSPYGIG